MLLKGAPPLPFCLQYSSLQALSRLMFLTVKMQTDPKRLEFICWGTETRRKSKNIMYSLPHIFVVPSNSSLLFQSIESWKQLTYLSYFERSDVTLTSLLCGTSKSALFTIITSNCYERTCQALHYIHFECHLIVNLLNNTMKNVLLLFPYYNLWNWSLKTSIFFLKKLKHGRKKTSSVMSAPKDPWS